MLFLLCTMNSSAFGQNENGFFSRLQFALSSKAQQVEQLIEAKDLDGAIKIFQENYAEIRSEKQQELKAKLLPIVESSMQSWIAKVDSLDASSGYLDDVIGEYKKLEGQNESSAKKYDLFGISRTQTYKYLYEKKVQIYDKAIGSFATNQQTSEAIKGFLLSQPRLLISRCKLNILSSDESNIQSLRTQCKKLLPIANSSDIDEAMADRKLAQLDTNLYAYQKLLEISKILKSEGLSGKDYELALKKYKPTVVYLDQAAIKDWLQEKRPDQIAVFFRQVEPTQKVNKAQRNSSYVSATETIPNAQYLTAQRNYQAAFIEYQNCQANYRVQAATNPYAMNFCAFSAAAANNAKTALDATPPTVRNEIYSTYSFEVNSIEIAKNGETNVFAYLPDRKTFIQSTTSVTKTKKFEIAIGLHPQDRHAQASRYQSEVDIRNFLEEKIEAPQDIEALNALMQKSQLMDTPEKSIAVSSSGVKSLTISEPKDAKGSSELSDILSSSIVVIKSRSGLGTGFYVRSKSLLTNHHVVEDQGLVQIEFKDGRTASGVVIQSDPALDLALIAVPTEGSPLTLLNKEPSVGSEAFALGHPKGLTFSVTKGIISAVRDMPTTIGIPMQLRYVQTDVPINSGNSGGPLLVGNNVVGVNTFKRVDKGVEGLGFALSSPRVIDWLNKVAPR